MTGPSQDGTPTYGRPEPLVMIRSAMFAGVALFGAVTFALHRQDSWSPSPVPVDLIYLPVVVTALALAGMFSVRILWSRATDETQRRTFAIIGWAMGEGAALAGGVYYYLTDDPRFYITGIFVLLASFMLLPIKRPD